MGRAQLQIAAQLHDPRAAPVGQIVARAIVQCAALCVWPGQRAAACAETGIGGDALPVLLQWDGQQPLAAVIEITPEDQQRARAQILPQIGGDLPAAIGIETGRTNAIATRDIAADHGPGMRAERARDVTIGAGLAIADECGLDQALAMRATLALHQIDRHPRLARGKQRAGAAAHGFHPLHRLIDLIKLRVFEERERGRRKERHAFALEGDIFRIAARGIAAHEDVGAILAAGGFDRQARDQLQHLGGAGGGKLVDGGAVDGGDGEGRLLALLAAARRADHHDIAGDGNLRRSERFGVGEDRARARGEGAGSATGTATSR